MRALQVERSLYGSNSGAIYRLLERSALSTVPLSLTKQTITAAGVSEDAFKVILKELESSLSLDARGRVRKVTLIAVSK